MALCYYPKISDSFEEFEIYGKSGFLKIQRKLFHTFVISDTDQLIQEFILWTNKVISKYEIVFRTEDPLSANKDYYQVVVKTPDDNEAMMIKLTWM